MSTEEDKPMTTKPQKIEGGKKKLLNNKNMKKQTLFTTEDVTKLVMSSIYSFFNKTIENDYSSPIKVIVNQVIADNTEKIKAEFQDALDTSFNDKEFMKVMRSEFKHKVAKTLVGKLEGSVERAVNAINQDQTLRARMILAIEKLIK